MAFITETRRNAQRKFILLLLLFDLTLSGVNSQFQHSYKPLSGNVYRTWSEWTSWSACSRSCGGGVRVRTRTCRMRLVSYASSLPKTCLGDTTEYELCEKKSCSPYPDDFLAYQCSQHNRHAIASRVINEWIPYKYAKNPCELQCQASDRAFLYSFGKVIDGTRCAKYGDNSPAICVNGRCTKIDCAGQLGTDNQMDICGICRGDNSTCVHYQNSYRGHPRDKNPNQGVSDNHYDYNRIAMIPAGATHVFVKETGDTNFLGLMEQSGKFLINGNWRIGSPGHFKMSGMQLIYNRTWDGHEIISISGPIPSHLVVLVLGRGDIPTVYYEYWMSTLRQSLEDAVSDSSSNPFKSLIRYDDYYRNESKQTMQNTNFLENHLPQHKAGYQITRSPGYKSYYHRNEIIKSQTSVKKYGLLKVNNAIIEKTLNYTSSTVSINTNHITQSIRLDLSTPQTILRKKQDFMREKKYRYDLERSKLSFAPEVNIAVTTLTPFYKLKLRTEESWSGRPNGTSELSSENRRELVYATVDGLPYKALASKRTGLASSNSTPASKIFDSVTKSNEKKSKFQKKKRKRKSNKECSKCPRVKHQKRNFCFSDFVLRAMVLTVEMQHSDIRYELEVIQSYKNKVPILSREYVWTPDVCRCPRLKTGKEYIIMGHMGSAPRRRESRLIIDKNSFVRRYTRTRARTMQRLVRDQDVICRRIL